MTICIKPVVKWSFSAIDFVVEPVSKEELEMAVSWSFALLLVLTLVAFITFSQPLFQSTPAAEMRLTREDLEIAPQPKHPTFKARESMVGRQRQHRTRKGMNERGEEQRQGSTSCCRGKRKCKTVLQRKTITFSRSTTTTTSERHPQPAAAARARTSNNYSNYAMIPRRSVSAHFESDRMVPTGPNPLHNNNRSQVIFP